MRFVILDHVPPEVHANPNARTAQRHFDLMFEVRGEDSLRTFASLKLPLDVGEDVEVSSLQDHRVEYLNYEGPISNDRGHVTRFAFGVWAGNLNEAATLSFDDDSKNFAGSTWTIRFNARQSLLLRIS